MSSEFRADDVQVSMQRRRLGGRLGWLALALLVVPWTVVSVLATFFPPGAHALHDLAPVLGRLVLASPCVGLLALIVRELRWKRATSVRVREGVLSIGRGKYARRIPLADLVEGRWSPLRREVALDTRGGQVLRVEAHDADEGLALLRATGLDAARRTMRIALGETTFLDLMVGLLGPVALAYPLIRLVMLAHWAAALTPLLFVLGMAGLFRLVRGLFGPAELVIGADGIIVQQRFRRRFFPHEAIARIDPGRHRHQIPRPDGNVAHTDPVTIHLTDGTRVKVKTRHLFEEEQAEMVSRLSDAARAFTEGADDTAGVARLDRHGRTPAAWREALRDAMRGVAYRVEVFDREDLLRVVASPAAPPERRLGAALALGDAGGEEERAKVRVAAEACAHAPLRIALEKAADGALTDAEIEAVMAEEEQTAQRVRRA